MVESGTVKVALGWIVLMVAAGCSSPVKPVAVSCAACHPAIAQRYAASGMDRSFHRATAASMPAGFAEGQRFHHAPSDRYYTLVLRDGKYYQRRHQVAPGGRETNIFESEIHFVTGSGNHAKSFLHRAGQGDMGDECGIRPCAAAGFPARDSV